MASRVAAGLAALLTAAVLSMAPAKAGELLMFDSDGCPWCEAWLETIGAVYHLTDEARVLPLRIVDNDLPRPDDLEAVGPVIYTPTFVVFHDGEERGRILGYPGEHFFWAFLQEFIRALQKGPDPGS